MNVLNLYACLGGNRLLWDNCNVTAVELDPELAKLYQDRFPDDKVIVADAHQYLLDHYKKFDFIWSSPPCPSHSRARYWGCKNGEMTTKPIYPDLKLYEEIIFLNNYFNGKYCVENVIPYYEPLIKAQKRGRHLYWTNFLLPININERKFLGLCQRTKKNKYQGNELDGLCEFHNYNFRQCKSEQKIIKIARNLVDYEAGKTIFDIARGIINKPKTSQKCLF
jgi:DNA (cytosine-5)-methyltransferase 1